MYFAIKRRVYPSFNCKIFIILLKFDKMSDKINKDLQIGGILVDKIKETCTTLGASVLFFTKWVFAALIIGLVGGAIGGFFHITLDLASELREENPWIIFLLPVAGLVIALLYSFCRKKGNLDTNRIIEAINTEDKVPVVFVPLIFVSTALTHLCGGSAGREGAALQLGGSIGYNLGKLARFNEDDLHTTVMAGMAAVFTALFGTPLTAAVFAIEVSTVGKMRYNAIVPCAVSSITSYLIAGQLGVNAVRFDVNFGHIDVKTYILAGILALLCAVLGILFCTSMQKIKRLAATVFENNLLRAGAGGVIIVLLTLLVRTGDYNGAGMHVIEKALNGEAVWYACLLKILFTAITLGCGFKGGEIVPAFFVGSTFGCVVGGLLGISPAVGAAIGFVALFCSSVNCPLASLLLGIEVFGGQGTGVFLIVCAISFAMSGRFGLYRSQRVDY